MRRFFFKLPVFIFALISSAVFPRAQAADSVFDAATFSGLPLRGIGPARLPGRVQDIAVDPKNQNIWYIATASSGLWKTRNRGLTFEPIFDRGGSYSLGTITIDPKDSEVLWLGTGENQSLRSVSFGDGVYKSTDGGETWQHSGLEHSEHIQRILVDPRDSKVVYVAAQGPLWAPGGDRGLYKTTDGGQTWKAVLTISENTGVTEVLMDPRNPDVLYASAYQRRRNVGLLIGGGPEAGLFKTENAGATWTKMTNGIPAVDLGRIAMAISPQNPDIIYAHITAARGEGGFFKSIDRGATWSRQNDYRVVDPQYYGEMYCDPFKLDSVYIIDSVIHFTADGGKTITQVPWRIHVDNHALTFDPANPDHLLVGNDGGLYETYDHGVSWRSFNNLPSAQFYGVAVDTAAPFYHIYAGAQDNGTVGGPSRTRNRDGIHTSDWGDLGGGDGQQPRVDPLDPTIIYVQSQNAALSRIDLKTGSSTDIKPRGAARFTWDAPLIVSPHLHTRLYLAGSRLFRSDDRGETWTNVSPDLTRQINRDTIPVMGRLWDSNAVTRNMFTTDFGVGTAINESSLKEGLLFYGSDDGLVQISENGGTTWRKIANFPGVPEMTRVSDLRSSRHNVNTVYVAFNNYERGDFHPYLQKSTDLGQTWTSIAGDLPDRHFVWSVLEDSVNSNLLFAGTEFGLYVTVNGGTNWYPLSAGVPTIAFRDLEEQDKMSDLVCGTFGRGIFILDDYSPLRELAAASLLPHGDLLQMRNEYEYELTGFMAAAPGNYAVTNPPFGAQLTYFLRDDLSKESPRLALTVTDPEGKEVRRIEGLSTPGLHRVNWDLRGAPAGGTGGGRRGADADADEAKPATSAEEEAEREAEEAEAEAEEAMAQQSATTQELQQVNPGGGERAGERGGRGGGGGARGGRGGRGGQSGPLVKPGKFTVTLNENVDGKLVPIGQPRTFEVLPLPANAEVDP
jgi:photosystem II stability/assembly factor-like uncharacterized protein